MHNRTIFFAIVALLLLSTGWWLWANVYQKGKLIRQRKAELAVINKQFEKIADIEESYTVLQERFDEHVTSFDTLKSVIPDHESFVQVLEEVRQVAEKQNVELISLSPILEDSFPDIKHKLNYTKKHIERIPIQIQLTAEYLTIGTFLEEILALPWIVNIGRISLETDLDQGGALICELVLYSYRYLDALKG